MGFDLGWVIVREAVEVISNLGGSWIVLEYFKTIVSTFLIVLILFGVYRVAMYMIKDMWMIFETISKYVKLKPHGRIYRGACPFHKKDRYDMFYVYPDSSVYKCWHCGAGGTDKDFEERWHMRERKHGKRKKWITISK